MNEYKGDHGDYAGTSISAAHTANFISNYLSEHPDAIVEDVLSAVDNTFLLNPGEVMGRFGKTTFAWYDTETGSGEIVEVV